VVKVGVVAFGVMRDFLPDDADGNRARLDVEEGALVQDVVNMLGAPDRLVHALLVNGERGRLDQPLGDGDEVTLMPPFTGGAEGERCAWAKTELEKPYHDTEWGVPLHDDRSLFEFIILEGVQAGLSWSTVLAKRDNYRAAFDDFDPAKVARYSDERVAELLTDKGLIRNRLKMRAAVTNARAFLDVVDSEGSFDSYVWSFVDGEPMINHFKTMDELPAQTDISRAMSKDLKRRGFKFVGPTICYAHMQATGMVNDHLVSCPRHSELTPDEG
jgi:DNA-3-methyladenine glycosylase I